MSVPARPMPAKLVVGFLLNDGSLMDAAAQKLKDRFGEVDMVSPWYDFGYTRYYEKEMGAGLKRRFLVFKPLIEQDGLPEVKTFTNGVEAQFTTGSRRRVNLDPGYLLLERFVLASGKNFSHRIYLKNGIYADLTLIYSKGAFQALPWTYPDYQSKEIQSFLTQVRTKYDWDLKRRAFPLPDEKLDINP